MPKDKHAESDAQVGVDCAGAALNFDPCRAVMLNDLLTASECKDLVSFAENLPLSDARVQTAPGQAQIRQWARSTSIAWIEYGGGQVDWIFERIDSAVLKLNTDRWRYDLKIIQPLQLSRYQFGDHFDWHSDVGAGLIARRKLSFSIQLTPSGKYWGGSLVFRNGQVASRELGSCTVFPSFLSHRVKPVLFGIRLALVGWFLGDRPLR